MILTIPFVPGHVDYHALSAEIRKRGPLGRHSLLVVSDADDADAAYDFGQETADMFDRATTTSVSYPNGKPKPIKLANDLFFAAMQHLKTCATPEGAPDVPVMLYLDPRYLPAKTGWLREIQSLYYHEGGPDVFGSTVSAGQGDERRFEGPVVIARPFVKRSALLGFLNPTIHWRIYLRSEMMVNFVETRSMAGDTDSFLRVPAKRQSPVKKPEPTDQP